MEMGIGYQISLFDTDITTEKEETDSKISIILWNIQNPSFERAKRQVEWILEIKPSILVLTEVKDSKGFHYIRAFLEFRGYTFIYNKSDSYFTVIAVKNISYEKKEMFFKQRSQRIVLVELDLYWGKVCLIGAYVPTNSMEINKIIIKKEFQDSFISEIKKMLYREKDNYSFIIGGDFNILEPDHMPRYPQFQRWNYFYDFFVNIGCIDIFRHLNPNKLEYTWVRGRDSQRIDHAFLSKEIVKYVIECRYIHYPRLNKLSDHSAMLIVLDNGNTIN